MSTVSLASRKGHFSTLDELTGCIRASMLVPGLAGPLISVPTRRPGSPMADTAEGGVREAGDEQMVPSSFADGAASDRDIVTTVSTTMSGEVCGESVGETIKGFDVGGSAGERATAQPQAGSADRGQAWHAGGGYSDRIPAGEKVKNSAVAAVKEASVEAAAAATAAFESSAGKEGGGDATELLADAMVFEPLPYRWGFRQAMRCAVESGCASTSKESVASTVRYVMMCKTVFCPNLHSAETGVQDHVLSIHGEDTRK